MAITVGVETKSMGRGGARRPIIVIQGAQWGSEAKGAVAAWMCNKRKVDYAVRTGAVNAGHTVMWPNAAEGQPIKMQQIPVGWVNPRTELVIGAGAFIYPEILEKEIALINQLTGEDCRERLWIDERASLHLPDHQTQAKMENRHHLIGATGKGCSVAITDKIRYRGRGYKLFREWMMGMPIGDLVAHYPMIAGVRFVDTVNMLHDAYDNGKLILLEGTQGTWLDLHLGPYPYTTHKQTTASQWVTEAGLSPNMEYEVVLVARTYPIRVAGNSGPMPGETTWPNIARDINRKLMLYRMPQRVKSYAIQDFEKALEEIARSGTYMLPKDNSGDVNWDFHKWTAEHREKYAVAISEMNKDALGMLSGPVLEELGNLFEMTTVTKKLRRVANWDPWVVGKAAKINRASYVVLTFWNYLHPELWGREFNSKDLWDPGDQGIWATPRYSQLVAMEASIGCPIKFVSTGPGQENFWPVVDPRTRVNQK